MKLDLSGLQSIESTDSLSLSVIEKYRAILNGKDYGFFHLNGQTQLLEQCHRTFEEFQHIKHFVQVGIGGSSLGAELLVQSLPSTRQCQFSFLNNVDTEIFDELFEKINLKETLFFFVSKSGGTVETMASLAVISNYLAQQGLKEEKFKEHMVFATDPENGDLRKLAKELNIKALDIPSNIGGRFSVLSPVGLFPALFKGINCSELLEGAEKIKPLLGYQAQAHDFFELANKLFLGSKTGFSQTVLMPYSSKLRTLSDWFVQLWAESLGKKENIHGEQVFTGLTPIASYGATDQHSQVQLFVEGPQDKIAFFIEVEKRVNDYSLKNNFDLTAMKKIKEHSLEKLLKAELEGTKKAFEQAKRPFIHLQVPTLNEESLGGLILFFESLTVLTGLLLEIDPFNQPGVEAGKKFAFEWLEKLK